MLVCPQCQFENPDENRFCQQCGTSLTEKTCHACGALVPLDAEKCHQCGATTETIFRAVVLPIEETIAALEATSAVRLSQPEAAVVKTAQIDKAQPKQINEEPVDGKPIDENQLDKASINPVNKDLIRPQAIAQSSKSQPSNAKVRKDKGVYLDTQQRYRLLDPLPSSIATAGIEVKVIDCEPFRISPIEALLQQDYDAAESAAELIGIPAIAHTYLTLQSQIYPCLPAVHDAWETSQETVVLLEDRSMLMPLLELWGDPDLPPFQMLHLLHQIVELWDVLQTYQCAQSLLEISNLQVDEDQLLCLQRLYIDRSDTPPQLTDLGKLWQSLFQKQPSREELNPLMELVTELCTAQLTSQSALRSRLEALADKLQPLPNLNSPDKFPADLPIHIWDEESPDEAIASSTADGTDEADITQPSIPLNAALETPVDLDENVVTEADDVPTIALPMKLISLEDVGRSDIGRQRNHNEDNFAIHTDIKKVEGLNGRTVKARGLYILCDGMGGHAGGEVASAMAVETLRKFFQENWQEQLPSESTIRQGILMANKAIYDMNQQDDRAGSGRMGTTLVLVLVQDIQAAVAHVGDSRLYRFSRRQGLQQVTVDHEVGQREIQRGVEPAIAYARPDAYQLTQALGPRDENFVSPDIQFLELSEDFLLLLCSDGLSDNDLLETHCKSHIEPLLSSQTNLEQGMNELIDLANQYNGHDNITAIAIRTKVRPNLEQIRYA